jgi:UDPglucose--hexose-1-phosphate uridylyltransferase
MPELRKDHVIETPNHTEEMRLMSEMQTKEVLWASRDRIADLSRDHRFKYGMVFKNKKARAGASLQHPHSEILALPVVPLNVREELDGTRQYYDYKDRCVFCDVVQQELAQREGVVEESAQSLDEVKL